MANDPFSALAHPLRREIVERLARSTTVGEVTRDFGVSKPTISSTSRLSRRRGPRA